MVLFACNGACVSIYIFLIECVFVVIAACEKTAYEPLITQRGGFLAEVILNPIPQLPACVYKIIDTICERYIHIKEMTQRLTILLGTQPCKMPDSRHLRAINEILELQLRYFIIKIVGIKVRFAERCVIMRHLYNSSANPPRSLKFDS